MTAPRSDLVPATEQMVGWIDAICAQGIRRPGFPADHWTEAFVVERFEETGLADVHLEPVRLPRWDPGTWSLEVGGQAFDCFPCPHTASCRAGVEAKLSRDDVKGNIALETVTLTSWPQSFVRDRLAIDHHDPDNEFDDLHQTLPFGPKLGAVMESAIEAGAVGWIGVFDAPWESCDYYVPYDGLERAIPGVWVSKADGARIDELLVAGNVMARIVVDSVREETLTHNIVGTLPGASDDWIIVGSHHDGPWVSAVEDASGVALVLAQAQYWSQVPQNERPHNLLFVVTSGHMVHGAGTRAFIDAHKELMQNVVLEVHLEHIARECKGVDGELVPTDDPETGWWFTTRNDTLVRWVKDALVAENIRRSFILPPDVFAGFPTTDGGFYHLEGVPLVNFLEACMYLFDSRDTPDKIHEASLLPVTRAAIRIMDSTRGTTASEMRKGQDLS
jgi:hypothetical protein